jgi:hypothetical protein
MLGKKRIWSVGMCPPVPVKERELGEPSMELMDCGPPEEKGYKRNRDGLKYWREGGT